jgi:hypothetical protein
MYTLRERIEAQTLTFELKKQGYKAVRIVRKINIGTNKDGAPIYDSILTSFGYIKGKNIPREIFEEDVDKYNFKFIYEN